MLNMCSLIYTSLGRETSYIQKCIKLYESDIKDRKSLLTGTVHVNNSLLAWTLWGLFYLEFGLIGKNK